MKSENGILQITPIARIYGDYPEKFGIPRQSGLVLSESVIEFEEHCNDRCAFRGIEGYSHLWLIWGFSANRHSAASAMVHPPRLGGNKKMGVFATRSPYRPNPLGLSSVKFERMEFDAERGVLLYVSGADLMDGTPIYDIKPYLSYTDSHPDATGGFSDKFTGYRLKVIFPSELLERVPQHKRELAIELLAQDPRPAYIDDADRVFGTAFAGKNIRFKVDGDILTVTDVGEYVPGSY